MFNESQVLICASVDVRRVRYQKPSELGIDFSNSIDAWAKMEFKFRKLIQHLQDLGQERQNEELVQKVFGSHQKEHKELSDLVYAIRQKLD